MEIDLIQCNGLREIIIRQIKDLSDLRDFTEIERQSLQNIIDNEINTNKSNEIIIKQLQKRNEDSEVIISRLQEQISAQFNQPIQQKTDNSTQINNIYDDSNNKSILESQCNYYELEKFRIFKVEVRKDDIKIKNKKEIYLQNSEIAKTVMIMS